MSTLKLRNCHDCGVEPGCSHKPNCDVERCSHCGGQALMCAGCPDENGTMRHDPSFSRWTGLWPGVAECMAMGIYAKFPGKNGGWEKCDANDPEGRPDLNTFYSEGYAQIFFVKPTKENGRSV